MALAGTRSATCATLRQAGTNTVGWGARLAIDADHYAVITTSAVPFAPGASRQIELRATLADLGFTTTGAVYAFGADVIASADAGGNYSTVGQLRTFVAAARQDAGAASPRSCC